MRRDKIVFSNLAVGLSENVCVTTPGAGQVGKVWPQLTLTSGSWPVLTSKFPNYRYARIQMTSDSMEMKMQLHEPAKRGDHLHARTSHG